MGRVYAADDVREYTYVVIWNADNSYNVYKCADRPMIFPSEGYLLLRVNDTEIQFPADQPRKFTFSKAEDIESGVSDVQSKGLFDVTQDKLNISGLKKGVKVAGIYSADGKQMMQGKTADGKVCLDVSGLKPGIYVVQCGDVKFKFLKK